MITEIPDTTANIPNTAGKSSDNTAKKFLRPAEVEAIYSIKPGVLYNLINSRSVHSIRLSSGPVKKATRLIEVASLEAYLASLRAQQTTVQAAA